MMSVLNAAGAELTLASQVRLNTSPDPAVVTRVTEDVTPVVTVVPPPEPPSELRSP